MIWSNTDIGREELLNFGERVKVILIQKGRKGPFKYRRERENNSDR